MTTKEMSSSDCASTSDTTESFSGLQLLQDKAARCHMLYPGGSYSPVRQPWGLFRPLSPCGLGPALWSEGLESIYTPTRRKVPTKDTTGALKLWLERHKQNPYPSKAEKIMLAILSKMTLTQVSTWFANARRRLKKDFAEQNDGENYDDLDCMAINEEHKFELSD